jgi:hypothetical protein
MPYTFSEANPPPAPIELSDGTAVILNADTGAISYTTDRTTLNGIATLSGGSRSAICRDASDNLYVMRNNVLTAFTKGTGRTWTQQTGAGITIGWQTTPTAPGYTIVGFFWVNVGGTGGAGQLAYLIINGSSQLGVTLFDAGVALAGTGANPYLSSYQYGVSPAVSFGAGNVVPDGFGQPGFWLTSNDATSVYVYYTTVTTASPSLTGTYTIAPAGSIVASPVGARYAPGALFVVYEDSAWKWAILGSTAIISGPTAFTFPTGITTVAGAAYVTSVGRIWVYGNSGSTTQPLARFGITPSSTPTIDTAATTETISGYTSTTHGIQNISVGCQSTSLVDYQVQTTDSGGTIWGGFTTYAAAPGAPTLTAPGVNAYVDATGTINFSASYNSLDGSAQNAYAFRIKTGGSYQYWNATSGALQSSIVWNTVSTPAGGSFTLAMPGGTLTNGNTYNWSMASQESFGSLQGPFASDSTFGAQTTPILNVTGPSGTVTDAMPIITWTTTPAGGTSQINYRIVIETGSYGTVPGSGTTVWDSGTVTSGANNAQVAVSLANNTTFRAFVQVQETGAQASAWQFATFSVAYDQPAVPTLTVTPDVDPITGCARMAVTVQGHDNLLSLADGSFEGSLGTWTAVSGCTILDSTTQSLDGSYSVKLTASTSGSMIAGTAKYTVLPSTQYTIMASFRAGTAARNCTVSVLFYNSSNTLLATVTSTTVADSSAGWAGALLTTTAPSTAVSAALEVTVASAASSEVHYVDCAGIFPGTVSTWCRGGLTGATEANVTRVDPNYPTGIAVRSGTAVPIDPNTQLANVYDYEAPIGVLCTYTANVQADI